MVGICNRYRMDMLFLIALSSLHIMMLSMDVGMSVEITQIVLVPPVAILEGIQSVYPVDTPLIVSSPV